MTEFKENDLVMFDPKQKPWLGTIVISNEYIETRTYCKGKVFKFKRYNPAGTESKFCYIKHGQITLHTFTKFLKKVYPK